MTEILPVAIGIGLFVSLLLSETLGVASAGMVVPGYLALYLDSPSYLVGTLLACLLTYGCVRVAGRFLILYGRRRTALAILTGYLAGAGVSWMLERWVPGFEPGAHAVVGFIIPGLVAIWMDRQGVFETLGALSVCSAFTRLVLLAVWGAELPRMEALW
ncbi:MAG TPA: poly-gamma-glutamate biosynthesis protein PgsC [Polyangiaceae bacterium]|nr:poly-gamma-glutamate biosynthesis protein PgsC [Polyangiaceae bacterium]